MWTRISATLFLVQTIQCISEPLLLTPLVDNGNLTEARAQSSVDPKHFLGFQTHTGFITVNRKFNNNLFFWFVPFRSGHLDEAPCIIWLQGGPGWSSLVGLFDLVGPFNVKNGQVTPRKVSWCNNYSMVFIDNPVGTGFSFTDDEKGIPDNEDDVGEQLYEFLRQFLQIFPELQQAPLFIAGQSYAGKYVPALGIQIHRHRVREPKINLKGLMIGNGLIDPRTMMRYSELCAAMGLLEGQDLDLLKELEQRVVRLIDSGDIYAASNAFNKTIEHIKSSSGVSIYNFIEAPTHSAREFEAFVNRKDVREWIHVGNLTFDLNNQVVYEKMLPDIMNTTKPWVEELLESYAILGYSGQLDIILPYYLSKFTYNALEWSRSKEYHKAKREFLYDTSNTTVVGYLKSGGNFVEALIRDAGHSAPADQPEVAKQLIDMFIEDHLH